MILSNNFLMKTQWFILFIIINFIVSYNNGFQHNCLINKFRYRRQINFGGRMLGEECISNDECRRTPVDGSKICLINQCQCSSGHIPIDAYRCVREFEQLSSSKRVTKSMELEESPGYGSICTTTKDCQHVTAQLECLRGMCVCLEGYVPLGKYLCYNIHGQGAPIIESSTTTTSTSTIFHPTDSEIVKSLSKLGNICRDDYYCQQSISHSHCYNGKCSCMNGYISNDLETCIQDTDYDSTTLSTKYKSLLGGKCLTNQNCQTSEAICLNNICNCPNGYFPIDDWNCEKDSEDSSNEELITITTTATISTASTTTGFLWWPWSSSTTTTRQSSSIDLKNAYRFRCVVNRQCISMDRNSHCTLFGRCVCNTGYKLDMISKEQRCIRQLINEEDCD